MLGYAEEGIEDEVVADVPAADEPGSAGESEPEASGLVLWITLSGLLVASFLAAGFVLKRNALT